MTKQAWFCPGCQKHHAPHCDTCPTLDEGTHAKRPDGVLPFTPWPAEPYQNYPEWMKSTFDQCAGCKGPCGNVACPKLPRVTCSSNNLPGTDSLHLGWFTPGLFVGAAQ